MADEPPVFVHPQGLCESESVGPGTRIWAFAHVLPGAVIGSGCNICDHAFIEGGAVIGSGVTLENARLVWGWVCTCGERLPQGPAEGLLCACGLRWRIGPGGDLSAA